MIFRHKEEVKGKVVAAMTISNCWNSLEGSQSLEKKGLNLFINHTITGWLIKYFKEVGKIVTFLAALHNLTFKNSSSNMFLTNPEGIKTPSCPAKLSKSLMTDSHLSNLDIAM